MDDDVWTVGDLGFIFAVWGLSIAAAVGGLAAWAYFHD